jgi:DNA-binding transcriptional regulator PaaX
MSTKGKSFEKLGPTQQKILLLLFGGLGLALSVTSSQHFHIYKGIAKEWKEINERQLRKSIRKLYQSKLVGIREEKDGTQNMILTERGKERVLRYRLDELSIPVPKRWDGKFRFVCFDIPETMRNARDALRETLQRLGFYKVQKSLFVFPYECKNEIDFVVELFGVRRYARYGMLDSIDIDMHLRKVFRLLWKG